MGRDSYLFFSCLLAMARAQVIERASVHRGARIVRSHLQYAMMSQSNFKTCPVLLPYRALDS